MTAVVRAALQLSWVRHAASVAIAVLLAAGVTYLLNKLGI
jgi:hypothetical protein